MSIELPEARILAKQLDMTLIGKTIKSYEIKEVERMRKIGFINRNLSDFKAINGKKILKAESRGNTIKIQLSDSMNLLIAPEYGGTIKYQQDANNSPKYHLKLEFSDGSILTIRITSMGVIYAIPDKDLLKSYIYQRDFVRSIYPDEPDFTWEWFQETVGVEKRQIKSLLVGKEAKIVGVSNATFQDIIYRARVHPKRRASDLSDMELKALYEAIKTVIHERFTLKGKTEFKDIFGVQGSYVATMGPNMKDQKCPKCSTTIKKIAYGGGHVYLCPNCQRE